MSLSEAASRARRKRKRATGTIDVSERVEVEVEVEVVEEPSPDIHKLFCYYNKLYFDDALGTCIVRWSSPRMSSCAGTCRFLREGGCEIHLSEPLLKKRSTTDLKKILLHEMIHAFLFITQNKKDRREHGPMFQDLMNTINSNSQADHQRPSGGYNITVYHDFHEEADSYRLHHWRCESCSDLIKRAINRKPSAADCIKKAGHGNVCGNSSCHWHSHQMSCGGTYAKIAEPPGYKDKTKASKEKQKNANSLESKKRRRNDTIKQQFGKGKKEFMVASAWLGYYADEESDEDIEPLVNKRTERRKRQKMVKKTMAAARENMACATFPVDPSRSQKGSVRDFSLVPHENCDGGAQIVNFENVSAIDSDEILDAEPLDHSAPLPLPSLPCASPSKSPAQDIVIYISDDSD